jgi:hypothetical protein
LLADCIHVLQACAALGEYEQALALTILEGMMAERQASVAAPHISLHPM